jgi:hypothetical protein
VIVLVAIIMGTTLGGYAVSGALSEPDGPPVTVGDVVRIFPLSGWERAGDGEVGGVPAVRLTRGTGSLDVLAPVIVSDADTLLRRYVGGVLRPDAEQLTVSEEPEAVELPLGTGLRVDYAGMFKDVPVRIEGQVTAVLTPGGTGVVFDGWGPEGAFAYSLADVEAMVSSSEVVT